MNLATVLVTFSALFCNSILCLRHGEIAYTMKQVSAGELEFNVTNGVFLLKAKASAHSDDIVACSVYKNTLKSQQLVESEGVQIEQIGQKKIKLMLQKCRQSRMARKRATTNDDGGDPFNHNIAKGQPFDPDFGTGSPSGPGSHFAIYPGTKWCGYENVAKNMTDLGEHRATDACCRTHDHCPYYIDRFESKYHYYNAYPWTISHCDCDQHLFSCLTNVNTDTSNSVGKLFFGLLDVQCFTFQKGPYCEDTSSFISKLWCSKTVAGTRAVMQKFPHKWGETGGQGESDVVG